MEVKNEIEQEEELAEPLPIEEETSNYSFDKNGVVLADFTENIVAEIAVPQNVETNVAEVPATTKLDNKKLLIIGGVLIVALGALFLLMSKGPGKRAKTLMNLEQNEYQKFKIGDQEFYIGKDVPTYKSKGLSYIDDYISDEDRVIADSIAPYVFYIDGKPMFYGSLYCASTKECKYDDTILIKINFYRDSNVIVNDFIKYGMKYDEVVEKYGKEDGAFYMDETALVWAFGEKGKIGEPYYILKFDSGGLFSFYSGLSEIRMGVWWYEGEYERTIVKTNSEGGK